MPRPRFEGPVYQPSPVFVMATVLMDIAIMLVIVYLPRYLRADHILQFRTGPAAALSCGKSELAAGDSEGKPRQSSPRAVPNEQFAGQPKVFGPI
jgi:hypothetical protein